MKVPDTFPVCGMKVFLNADGYMQIQEAEGRTLLSVASGPPSNISKQSVSRTDELFPTHCPLSSSTRELGLSYFYVGCRDQRAASIEVSIRSI